MRKTKTNKCIRPGCENKVRARGLCASDYIMAQHVMNTGKATEEELVTAGKMLPLLRRQKHGAVTAWLLEEKA